MTEAVRSFGAGEFTPKVRSGALASSQEFSGHSAASEIAMPMIPLNASLAGEVDRHGAVATRRDHGCKI
jgi:hypothetical protein